MTDQPRHSKLQRFFAAVIARARFVVLFYALLIPPSAWFAMQVAQDNSIDRLVVASDPDAIATHDFEKVFGGGEYAVLLAEADDPFAPGVVARLDAIEKAVAVIPKVSVNSVLSIFRRARAGFTPDEAGVAAFRAFARGSDLFRKQGLLGDRFLSIALVLDVHGAAERSELLATIDRAVAAADPQPGPLAGLYRLGQPWVNAWLDETQRSAPLFFLLFAAFVVVLNLMLYRSWRALALFLVTLAVCLCFSVGYIGATGGNFTLVSPMVPMTILVTATATLVYLHSRFVERPADRPLEEHRLYALENKFLACTASIFATAVGFAALVVSDIQPIKEMGVWVAVGLLMTWVVVFTLFPALQSLLKCPTQVERRTAGAGFERLAAWLPLFTYRWRWPLVLSSLVASAAGAVALFGLPGMVKPLPLLTDPVEYLEPSTPLYRDIKRLGPMLPGLSVTHVWLKGPLGAVSEPEVLDGLDRFQRDLETDPDVGSAVGPTTILRMIRYIGGQGDGWPSDADALDGMAADLEGLVGVEPLLQRFVQPHQLAQTQFTVLSRVTEHADFVRLEESIRRRWADAVESEPALSDFEIRTVGLTPLNAKMAQSLVPTLVESFYLTVLVIFVAFLAVFRNGLARIMAMLPSLFAILVMFGVMRLCGVPLNVATILIASTILGTSENDQIHFFWHFQEGREDGSVEQALRHTFLVAGRAIFFATLINAGGFLAFTLAGLPAMRQFGALSALAFVLSMVADFFALPAALWILMRARPDPR